MQQNEQHAVGLKLDIFNVNWQPNDIHFRNIPTCLVSTDSMGA